MGSTLNGSATFFRGDLIMKYFLQSFSPFRWFKKGSCPFLAEECTILVNRLEYQACPVNVWLGKLTALDMTPLGWLSCKTSTQINTRMTAVAPCTGKLKQSMLDRTLYIHVAPDKTFLSTKKYQYFFSFFHKTDAPPWGTSNEYPQHMFSWKILNVCGYPLLSVAMTLAYLSKIRAFRTWLYR